MNRKESTANEVLFAVMGACLFIAGPVSASEPSGAAEQQASSSRALPFPTGDVRTINVIEWDANALPPVYERSDELPLTDDDLRRLVESDIPPEMVVKMIEERRCACDSSARGLVAMSEAGFPNEVIAAVSTHALRPNRHLNLFLTFDFDGESRVARERYLYIFIEDGDVTRVFRADLGAMLATPRRHETMVDRSDLLISRTVRRVQLAGEVPLKTYGRRHVMVVTSARPALTHPSQLSEGELEKAGTYTIEYPRSSLSNICRLDVGYRRDVMLTHLWHFVGSRLECEWN